MHTVFVCINCDKATKKIGIETAKSGKALLKRLKIKIQSSDMQDIVNVKSIKCLGGCEEGKEHGKNSCCCVGFNAVNKHACLFNKLTPEDDWKILEFLKLYIKNSHGRIITSDSTYAEDIRPHYLCRIPPSMGN